MTSSTERHAALIDAGWRVGVDGRWRSPAVRIAAIDVEAEAAR